MAVRIRKNGRIFCAATHPEMEGDTYLDDEAAYYLSAIKKVLVTEPMERHQRVGEWWWKGNVPEWVEIDEFYKNK